MRQTQAEREGIQLALREIAQAREHLRLAGDIRKMPAKMMCCSNPHADQRRF